jgi:hypothetical protein
LVGDGHVDLGVIADRQAGHSVGRSRLVDLAFRRSADPLIRSRGEVGGSRLASSLHPGHARRSNRPVLGRFVSVAVTRCCHLGGFGAYFSRRTLLNKPPLVLTDANRPERLSRLVQSPVRGFLDWLRPLTSSRHGPEPPALTRVLCHDRPPRGGWRNFRPQRPRELDNTPMTLARSAAAGAPPPEGESSGGYITAVSCGNGPSAGGLIAGLPPICRAIDRGCGVARSR